VICLSDMGLVGQDMTGFASGVMSATEMNVMTMTAPTHIEDIYKHSWNRKDAIKPALLSGERSAISSIKW
tara:strand:+ start:23181 stop:23390 length:210 start_codon:yes stop_codon:yes gene_type:complete